ncbi:hypothetical protein LEP48_12565 [Isoptericola sp. NEAU-Y5]|uniref:Uncharacterized protein n=1 Tax=Isoptericola luteus TaxID=2879484 RepID=A0ABS7ZGN1_9MICO|nr:hypothetical protein [Isoptericola sp. NEAU-Y5]MCA5894173.1 hypothetical protein [Isoptericola sp. NEAU-Y5]
MSGPGLPPRREVVGTTEGTPTDAFATAAGTELANETRRRFWGRRAKKA